MAKEKRSQEEALAEYKATGLNKDYEDQTADEPTHKDVIFLQVPHRVNAPASDKVDKGK